MKNKLFLLSVLGITAFSNYASAQCSNSGIGTTAPAAKLDIRGCGSDSTTSALKVANSTDTTVNPILFIRNDNRIGVGTKFPQTMFDVNGTIFGRQGFKFPDGTIQTTAATNFWSLGSGQYSLVNNSSGGNVAIAQSSFIGGGETNHIGYYGYNSIILGGINNYVGDDNCAILSGSGNTIQDPVIFQGGPGQSYNLITGGSNNLIHPQVTNSAIIHGYNNSIGSGVANSIILGGHDLSATQSNTVYMQNISVASLAGFGDSPIMVDSNGMVRRSMPNLCLGPQYWSTNGTTVLPNCNPFIGTLNNYPFIIKTNGQEGMRVTEAGNVIIGNIPSPSAMQKLEVHGSISIYDGAGGSGANDDGDNSLFFGREQTSLNTPATDFGEWGIQYWNGASKQTSTGGSNTWGGLNFWKPFGSTGTTGNNFLFIEDDGNVGLGTANPTSRLQVQAVDASSTSSVVNVTNNAGASLFFVRNDGNVGIGTTFTGGNDKQYRLAVAGKIGVKDEMIVENSSLAWYDFVFESSYQRMNYQEKELFFKKNKHLPNVDSEKEITGNGLKVSKTLAGVTFNVEENSLDIIDLYKQNDNQKDEIQKLKEENELLKKQLETVVKNVEALKTSIHK